jgi:hypothetical protein
MRGASSGCSWCASTIRRPDEVITSVTRRTVAAGKATLNLKSTIPGTLDPHQYEIMQTARKWKSINDSRPRGAKKRPAGSNLMLVGCYFS